MKILFNITYQGQAGNYNVDIDPTVDDATVKQVAEEAIRSNEVPNISPDLPQGAFDSFVVDRFEDGVARFVIRPKVPFG